MSNLVVEGVIGRISAKPWQNKTFYSIALNGQEGWYNLGVKRPPKEGTSVRFEFKTNAKGFKEVDGPIEIRADGEVGPALGVSQGSSYSGVNSKSGSNGAGASGAYWDRKESRDIRNDDLRELGATRNTAIAIIDLMIKHEAIKLPAVAKREEFLWTVLDRYVNKLRGKEEKIPEENQKVEEAASTDTEADAWN